MNNSHRPVLSLKKLRGMRAMQSPATTGSSQGEVIGGFTEIINWIFTVIVQVWRHKYYFWRLAFGFWVFGNIHVPVILTVQSFNSKGPYFLYDYSSLRNQFWDGNSRFFSSVKKFLIGMMIIKLKKKKNRLYTSIRITVDFLHGFAAKR